LVDFVKTNNISKLVFICFLSYNMEVRNLIIIGSWPAWYTAAIYATRALLNPLLFEGYMAWGIPAGGQLTTTTTVYNFPWFPEGIDGPELMLRIKRQCLNQWVEVLPKTVERVDLSEKPFKVYAWGELFYTKSIIVATWATALRLWVPWEDKYWQRGISACAICDWWLPMYRNWRLLVVWWWDAALEEANYLTKFASKVSILVRRDVLRAAQSLQQKVFLNDKIEIVWNTEVKEVFWDSHQLKWVKAVNNKTNEKFNIECEGLFYAIWHKPNTEFLSWQLKLDDNWCVITEIWSTATSVEWVFAAWDVLQSNIKFRQAIVAAGSWCIAALQAEEFLKK